MSTRNANLFVEVASIAPKELFERINKNIHSPNREGIVSFFNDKYESGDLINTKKPDLLVSGIKTTPFRLLLNEYRTMELNHHSHHFKMSDKELENYEYLKNVIVLLIKNGLNLNEKIDFITTRKQNQQVENVSWILMSVIKNQEIRAAFCEAVGNNIEDFRKLNNHRLDNKTKQIIEEDFNSFDLRNNPLIEHDLNIEEEQFCL